MSDEHSKHPAPLTEYVTDERPEETPRRALPRTGDALIQVEPLKQSSMQPSYAQTLALDSVDNGAYGSMITCLGSVAGLFGSIPCCFCCPNPYKSVSQGSVGLISRFGQFYKSVDPGLVKINPYSEKIRIVDVKIQIAPVSRQSVVTRDNVTVEIDSVIYYHIVNPFKAAFGISDVRLALTERSQTTLRNVVGSRTLQSLLTDREAVAAEIEAIVEDVAARWGISIESILIKDIVFSQELQQSLSSGAQQKRIGEAKIISARAEVDAAQLMRKAADILSSPAAMQIRQLETLQAMAKSANAKCIFVPMNLFSGGGDDLAGPSSSAPASGPGANIFSQAGMLENLANTK